MTHNMHIIIDEDFILIGKASETCKVGDIIKIGEEEYKVLSVTKIPTPESTSCQSVTKIKIQHV